MKKNFTWVMIIVTIGGLTVLFFMAKTARKKSDDILKTFNEVDVALDSVNTKQRRDSFLAIIDKHDTAKLYSSLMPVTTPEQTENLMWLHKGMVFYNRYIDSLKEAFEATFKDEADLAATENFFLEQKNGEMLFGKMMAMRVMFKNVVISDSVRQKIFSDALPGRGYFFTDGKVFAEKHFAKIPAVAALIILAYFKNNANNCEMAILKDYSNLATIRITK